MRCVSMKTIRVSYQDECLSEDDIVDLAEGQLSPAAIERAEKHIDGCVMCSELVAAATRQLVSVTSLSADHVPEDEAQNDDGPAIPNGYRVLEPLGSGGMGIVYHAIRIASGEHVALKTVPIRSANALSALRREIDSLGRVSHPGVVRVLDQGVIGGRPWYAMELIEGDTFEDHVRKAHGQSGRRKLDLEDPAWQKTFGILIRVCDALACLHANGFVHCDLTPRNVIVRNDGRPVVVDFGLTQRNEAIGRDLLDTVALGGGTIAYMAPEQIRGEAVDPRTDLYSFGCLLYRTITGAPVFRGTNPLAVVRGHLDQMPVPPSARADGVPLELDALVMQLLRKRPQNRLGYADDVATALRNIVGSAPESRPTVPASYLYRPELVGREEPLRELTTALDVLTTSGRGGRFHLGGESGVGKTRLALEAMRLARHLGLGVIVGQCGVLELGDTDGSPSNQGPLHPFAPLLLAIADRCRELGPIETERVLGVNAPVLAAFQPALLGVSGTREKGEPIVVDAVAARTRVLAALRETLFAFANGNPFLLVLDDLQWGDELTLDFLGGLGKGELENAGIVFLGTYRVEELSPELEKSFEGVDARSFVLPRFGVEDVKAMVSGMLALHEPPPQIIALLSRYCEGNPFFVAEYLRAAISAGMLSRDRQGNWQVSADAFEAELDVNLPFPQRLMVLIERRLADVGPEAAALVDAGSVLGRAFDVDMLLGTAAVGEGVLALDALRRRQIIEEAGAGRMRFVHDKIREIAYAKMGAEHRVDLHRRAGSLLERRLDQDPAAAAELGHHFASGEVPDRAAKYYAIAGQHAFGLHANGEALGYLSRALALGKERLPRRVLAGIEERRGDVLTLMGKRNDARASFENALARMKTGARVEKSRLLWKIARTLETEHRHGEALLAYDAAEGVLGPNAEPLGTDDDGSFESAWWHQWVHLQVERVWVHYWLGNVEAMDALVGRARPIIEQRGTPAQRARFFQALVHANMRRERWATSDETVHFARRSVEAARETSDPAILSYAQFVLGFQLTFSRTPLLAEPVLLDALGGAEKVGDLALVGRCLTYLTVHHRLLGKPRETQAFATRALKTAIELAMPDYRGVAHANLGWVAWREGRTDAAKRETEAALAQWAALAPKYPYPMQWMARLQACSLSLDAGNFADANAHTRVILALDQHALPTDLVESLRRATDAYEGEDSRGFEAILRAALACCASFGYC